MGDWVDTTLGELVLLQRGMDLPSRLREPGPFAVLGSNGPVGTHSEGPVEGPGVVIGRATNLGRPTWWWDNYWPLNTCLYVRDVNAGRIQQRPLVENSNTLSYLPFCPRTTFDTTISHDFFARDRRVASCRR